MKQRTGPHEQNDSTWPTLKEIFLESISSRKYRYRPLVWEPLAFEVWPSGRPMKPWKRYGTARRPRANPQKPRTLKQGSDGDISETRYFQKRLYLTCLTQETLTLRKVSAKTNVLRILNLVSGGPNRFLNELRVVLLMNGSKAENTNMHMMTLIWPTDQVAQEGTYWS